MSTLADLVARRLLRSRRRRRRETCGCIPSKEEFKGEIWEEWALTYGRNGSSERKKTPSAASHPPSGGAPPTSGRGAAVVEVESPSCVLGAFRLRRFGGRKRGGWLSGESGGDGLGGERDVVGEGGLRGGVWEVGPEASELPLRASQLFAPGRAPGSAIAAGERSTPGAVQSSYGNPRLKNILFVLSFYLVLSTSRTLHLRR